MTKTSEIYKTFEGMKFVKLVKNDKKPYETDWVKKPYTYDEVKNESFGVLGGQGGYVVLDIDRDFDKAIELLLTKIDVNTFAVESGSSSKHNKKVHLYYKVNDIHNLKSNKVNNFGELITFGSQAVCAGMIHPVTRAEYKIINNIPIVELGAGLLDEALELLGHKKVSHIDLKTEIAKHTINENSMPITKYDERVKFLLEDSEIQKVICKKKTGMKNNYLFPNIAAFVKYNPEYLPQALDFCVLCNYTEAEFNGWFKKDSLSINKNQLDEFFSKNEIAKEYKEYKLKPYTVKDLIKDQSAPIEYLILDFLEKGILRSLIGESGGGKTMITYYVACCIVTGSLCFDKPVKKCNVLILDNETGAKHKRNRILGILKGMNKTVQDIEDRLHFRYYATLGEYELAELREYILEHDIEYVVVDNLRSHFGVDENSQKEVGEALRVLNDIKYKTGCTIEFLHHTNKGDKYSGSTAIMSHVDESMTLGFKKGKVEKEGDSLIFASFKEGKERNSSMFTNFNIEIKIKNKIVDYEFCGKIYNKNEIDVVSFNYNTESSEEREDVNIKQQVINALRNGEISGSELRDLLPEMTDSTYKRKISEFTMEGIVKVSRKDGKNNYYILNPNYKIILN